MSQNIVEVKGAALLGCEAFSHQIEDVEVLLMQVKVDQTRLLQHVRVQTGLNKRCLLDWTNRCVNYVSALVTNVQKTKRQINKFQKPALFTGGKIR